MHHFSKKLFDKALLENRLEPILKECVRPIDIGASIVFSRFLTEMFNHMHWLLSDAATPPFLKNRTIEFLAYLVLLSLVDILQLLERKLLPLLRQVCTLDANLPLGQRGSKMFAGFSKQPQQAAQLEAAGVEYYRRCIESIKVWAMWLPDSLNGQPEPSLFVKSYRTLRNEGVTFPSQAEMIYYNHDVIDEYEQRIVALQCKEQIGASQTSMPMGASFSSQTAQQFWKNENKFLKENQLQLLNRVQELEGEVARLTKEVISRDKKIAAYEKREGSNLARRESTQQSSGLTKNRSDGSSFGRGSSPTPTIMQFRGQSPSTPFLSPPPAANPMNFQQKFKELSEEHQFRFRKSLIRDKYTLFKNDKLQIGCKFEKAQDKARVAVYFRNMSEVALQIVSCEFVSTVGGCQQPNKFPYRVEVGKQIKLMAAVDIGKEVSLLGGLYVTNLGYKCVGMPAQQAIPSLYLPLCWLKLISFQPEPNQERLYTERYAKVIRLNQKILGAFQQVQNCFGESHSEIIQNRPQLSYKCQSDGQAFLLLFYELSKQYLKLEVVYNPPSHNLCVQLLKELEFALNS